MRISLLALLASSGLLFAAPASAISNWDPSAVFGGGQALQISLHEQAADLSALLSSGDLARLLAAAPSRGGADTFGQVIAAWHLERIFGPGLPTRVPVPGTPGPAVPEPGAALVFGAGLLLAARATRRRA